MRVVQRTRSGRDREHGGAMLVTLVIITAVLSGAAILVSLQLASNRSTDLTRSGLSALYCAEAGVAGARAVVSQNYENWSSALANPNVEPVWLQNGFNHDIDGDNIADFKITLKDNDDELPATNNPNVDIDMMVFVQSECIKYPETPKKVSELLLFKPAMNCYESQEGGCNARGNANR